MAETSPRNLYPWFIVLGLVVGALVIVAFYKDQFREWRDWQRAYVKQELARATTPVQKAAAARKLVEIRQVLLPGLDRVDRCQTCHIVADDPSYAGLPQPLAYHPNHFQHPFEKFGCTICHQGQGRATTREAAHGNVPHWDHPMLPLKYIESACAKCHLPTDVPGAPHLAHGRALFDQLGCIGCHKLHGVGGVIGPELETVGATRSPGWLARHFRTPSEVTAGSPMPPVKMGNEDIDALTLYMLSLTGEPMGDYYVSMKTLPSAEAGSRLFVEKGCIGCHSVGDKGGKVGPPLDELGKRHNAEWIIAHFRNPQAVSPGSVMPAFNFTEQEMRALTEFLLTKTDPSVIGYLKIPALMTPVERGRQVFKKYGCVGCHGQDANTGIRNPNAKTAQLVPGLKFVSEGYTKDESKKRILNGQKEIAKMDPKGVQPPLYMPAWRGRIAEGELNDLVEYIFSLLPKGEKESF